MAHDDMFVSGVARPVEIELPAGKRTVYLREIGFADAVAFADARASSDSETRTVGVATLIARSWVNEQGEPVTTAEAARDLKPEAANALVRAIFGDADDAGNG